MAAAYHLARARLFATYYAVSARNRVWRRAWDVLTPAHMAEDVRRTCLDWTTSQAFKSQAWDSGDTIVDNALYETSSSPTISYVCRRTGDLLIEPKYGYVIDAPLRLIEHSMPPSEWARDPRFMHLIGVPSTWAAALARAGVTPRTRVPRVLSLRHFWETNYFHFLCDVVPKLRLARECGIPDDVPLLVGGRLFRQPFFQRAMRRGLLQGREFVVQDGDYLAAEDVVFARSEGPVRANLEWTALALGAPNADPNGHRRIFLTRQKSRGRYLLNQDELLPTLKRWDIELIDTDTLTLDEQMDLFSRADVVVGIHGAGLANILYRRGGNCSVLELYPPGELVATNAWIAGQLGFNYKAIRGYAPQTVERFTPFSIDAEQFALRLEQLLH